MVLPQEVTVFPRLKPCSLVLPAEASQSKGLEVVSGKGFEGDLERILEYSGADPLKLIHWRLSARHEELKVKSLSSMGAQPVTVAVDELAGNNSEERISCAAYLVNTLAQEGCPVGLRVGAKEISPDVGKAHRLSLLTELALYGQD